MLDADLAFAGVARQADLVRRGEVSARALAELTLRRIDQLDGELNAFCALDRDRALQQADAADRRRGAGEDAPLLGVPIAVKDEFDVQGEVTGRGTGAIATAAAADAEVVRRLRAAGAVLVGRTTMPELGLWPFTESVTWGITRNPWDVERTPGGSSGGSAAAVAAGMVPAALAADGAGSIRIPAACCGLFGLKPHRGRVPRAPHDQASGDWVVAGALTRSVLDTALVLDAIRGPAAGETDPLPDPPCSFVEAARSSPQPLRIAVSRAFPRGTLGRLAPEVARALDDTAQLLGALGHEVVDRDIDFGGADARVILGLMFRGIRDLVQEVERPHRLERRTRALARPGALVSDRALTRLRGLERELGTRVGRLFADHDVLLTPVMSRPAVRAGAMEGRGATVTYLWSAGWVPFNVVWNSTGQPAASVPAGFTDAGLPLAVQLVGRPQAETTLLSLSAQLEAARPWTHRRPALRDPAGRPAP